MLMLNALYLLLILLISHISTQDLPEVNFQFTPTELGLSPDFAKTIELPPNVIITIGDSDASYQLRVYRHEDGIKTEICSSLKGMSEFVVVDLFLYERSLRIGTYENGGGYVVLDTCDLDVISDEDESMVSGEVDEFKRELSSFVWYDEMAIVSWNMTTFLLTLESGDVHDLGDGGLSDVGALMFVNDEEYLLGFVYDREFSVLKQFETLVSMGELVFLNQSSSLDYVDGASTMRVVRLGTHGYVCFLVTETGIRYWIVDSGITGEAIIPIESKVLAGFNQVSDTQVFFYFVNSDNLGAKLNLIFDITNMSFTQMFIPVGNEYFLSLYQVRASELTGFQYSGYSDDSWQLDYSDCSEALFPNCICTFQAPFITLCERCQEWYQLNGTSGCVGIDECDENFPETFIQCPDNSMCNDILTGFECNCFDVDLSQNRDAHCPTEMEYFNMYTASTVTIPGTIKIIAHLPNNGLLIISDMGFIILDQQITKNRQWSASGGFILREFIIGYLILDEERFLLIKRNGGVEFFQLSITNTYDNIDSMSYRIPTQTGTTFLSIQPADVNSDGKIDFVAILKSGVSTFFTRYVQTTEYNFARDGSLTMTSFNFLENYPFSVVDNQILVADDTNITIFDINLVEVAQITYPRDVFNFSIGTSIIEKIGKDKYLFSTGANRIASLDISDKSEPSYFSFLYLPSECQFGRTIGTVPSQSYPSINDIVYMGCDRLQLIRMAPLYPNCTEGCNGGTCEVTVVGENCYCEENYEFFEGDCLIEFCFECLSGNDNAECIDITEENHQCVCEAGYTGCIDVNECVSITECSDIDECEEQTHNCGNDICMNKEGGYGCCPQGATCAWNSNNELIVTGVTSNVRVEGDTVISNSFNFELGSLTVTGSVNITQGTVLVFTGANELNASGCVNFEQGATVEIDIDEERKKELAKLNEQIVLIRSTCISGIAGSVSECEDGVQETISIDEEIGMQVVYGQCIDAKTMAIIIVAASVVVVLVLVFLLLVMFTPLKQQILPNRDRGTR